MEFYNFFVDRQFANISPRAGNSLDTIPRLRNYDRHEYELIIFDFETDVGQRLPET